MATLVYSPKYLEGVFSEVRLEGILRSSRLRNADIRSRFAVSHPRL
jgi:hypothetical protein